MAENTMTKNKSSDSSAEKNPTRQFNFISGLPRSGSTLTSALLRQNPRFHAGMTGPVAGLFEGVLNQVSAGNEMSTMVDGNQRARILRGLFDSYYADVDRPVIFDTRPLLDGIRADTIHTVPDPPPISWNKCPASGEKCFTDAGFPLREVETD